MLDSTLERLLTYRLGVADCWGRRRHIRHGSRNRIWFLDPAGLSEPEHEESGDAGATATNRRRLLAAYAESGAFTHIEIATLAALVIGGLSVAQIAERDGCSRQAVLARIIGNSRGQGGILKKARAWHVRLLQGGIRLDDGRAEGSFEERVD